MRSTSAWACSRSLSSEAIFASSDFLCSSVADTLMALLGWPIKRCESREMEPVEYIPAATGHLLPDLSAAVSRTRARVPFE